MKIVLKIQLFRMYFHFGNWHSGLIVTALSGLQEKGTKTIGSFFTLALRSLGFDSLKITTTHYGESP